MMKGGAMPTTLAPDYWSTSSDYAHFKFNEEFDGKPNQAFIWMDRFITQVNKHRLIEQ